MRQMSTRDQNDTDINNYRSPYGLHVCLYIMMSMICPGQSYKERFDVFDVTKMMKGNFIKS